MKERPIIMQAESVLAILDGRKTQARRVVKLTNSGRVKAVGSARNWHLDDPNAVLACPHGQPGDRLWVKEAFRIFDSSKECACYDQCSCSRMHGKAIYRASSDTGDDKWKAPLYMPRLASRITLELVKVRVERVQDISEADAKAEGVTIGEDRSWSYKMAGLKYEPHKEAYKHLWDSIHGKNPDRCWDANPWTWVLEFKRVKP